QLIGLAVVRCGECRPVRYPAYRRKQQPIELPVKVPQYLAGHPVRRVGFVAHEDRSDRTPPYTVSAPNAPVGMASGSSTLDFIRPRRSLVDAGECCAGANENRDHPLDHLVCWVTDHKDHA